LVSDVWAHAFSVLLIAMIAEFRAAGADRQRPLKLEARVSELNGGYGRRQPCPAVFMKRYLAADIGTTKSCCPG